MSHNPKFYGGPADGARFRDLPPPHGGEKFRCWKQKEFVAEFGVEVEVMMDMDNIISTWDYLYNPDKDRFEFVRGSEYSEEVKEFEPGPGYERF